MTVPPEQREALLRRKAELRARMDELWPRITSADLEQWIALYKEREDIEKQLGDDV